MSNLTDQINHIHEVRSAQRKEMEEFISAGGVYVTVAGSYSLGISKDNRLIYFPSNTRRRSEVADFGPSTIENINSIIYALGRLKTHATEE